MREIRESDEPECKTCGACCTGKDGDFVPVGTLDKRRLPTKYIKKLQKLNDPETPLLLGMKRFGDGQACVALKGTLGKEVSCDIYAQRPEHCRTFERGGDACKARRAEAFVVMP